MKLGGVGRNIAEVLSRLGSSVSILSMVGNDEQGRALQASCKRLSISTDALLSSSRCRTATYTALLDGSGELVGAIADMEVFDALTPAVLPDLPALPRLLLCDANLPAETLDMLLVRSRETSTPAWFEPVSVAKSIRGRCSSRWQLMSPNWDELLAIVGLPAAELPCMETGLHPHVLEALRLALADISDAVVLTLGPMGVVLARAASLQQSSQLRKQYSLDVAAHLLGQLPAGIDVTPLRLQVEDLSADDLQVLWYQPQALETVRDVTGAGDNFLAGTAQGCVQGWPLEEAIVLGMVCAHLVLHVEGGVPQFFSKETFKRIGTALGRDSSKL